MCQCRLHAVPWSYIGILMRHLAAEPRSTAGLLSLSQCPSGTILLTPYSMVWDWWVSRNRRTFIPLSVSLWNDLTDPYSMVWDWWVSRAEPILFYWPKLLSLLLSSTFFLFLFFLYKGWYCGAVVFELIGCIYHSLSALHC